MVWRALTCRARCRRGQMPTRRTQQCRPLQTDQAAPQLSANIAFGGCSLPPRLWCVAEDQRRRCQNSPCRLAGVGVDAGRLFVRVESHPLEIGKHCGGNFHPKNSSRLWVEALIHPNTLSSLASEASRKPALSEAEGDLHFRGFQAHLFGDFPCAIKRAPNLQFSTVSSILLPDQG